MSRQLDDGMAGWIGRCVSEWKKDMFKLSDTVHKLMLDGQSEELDWSHQIDLHQVRHIIT